MLIILCVLEKMKRIVISLIPLIFLILIVIVGVIAIKNNSKENELATKFENHEIIDLPQFSFQNLYQNQENLTNLDFKEGYSLLNIFASWCVTCHAEHDILLELAKSKKIKIYGIAFQDIDENTKKYLENNGNPYLKVGVDRRGELRKLLSVNGVPESFLINNKGQIIYRHQGNLTQDMVKFLTHFRR